MIDEIPEEVVWRYNERAHIENHIKEIKGGFGMDRLPSGDLRANAVYFGIGIMTYNLFISQKILTLPKERQGKTIKSIRWLLVEVALEADRAWSVSDPEDCNTHGEIRTLHQDKAAYL